MISALYQNRLSKFVLDTLITSGHRPEQIDAVVKTGGSSIFQLLLPCWDISSVPSG
jgi:hypothetical protein